MKRLLVAQLNELSVRESTSIYIGGIAILTVAWAHLETVSMTNILVWLAYMIVIMLARLKTLRKNHTCDDRYETLVHWRNWRVFLNIFFGAGWGAMMFLLNTRQLDFLLLFKLATITAVLGVTMNYMSVILPAYIGFIIPLFLLLLAYIVSDELYLSGQTEVKFVVGLVVYAALLTITANRTSKLSNVAFEQGFERDIALKDA